MSSNDPTPAAAGQKLSGAQIFVEALRREGVRYVFGYPGGAVLPLYDAIYQQDYFQHILVRHEQAAVHAADGYARSTGRVGVALVTSGPGATNAVTGIATAYADSVPLVVFSGQVGTGLIGSDAFQECDTVGITRPCVKHNYLVKDVSQLATVIKRAFHIAASGRPGPVLVDLPKDTQVNSCPFEYPESVDLPSYRPVTRGHRGQIKRALQALLLAERPLFYIGGGVISAGAHEELSRCARALSCPVISTLLGIGGCDPEYPYSLGMVGMHGSYEANMALQRCDTVLAVGTRFDDRVIGNLADWSKHPHTVIQIDVDPSSISKNVPTDIPIVGDAKLVLADLLEEIEALAVPPAPGRLGKWLAQIDQWRAKKSLSYRVDTREPIRPQAVIERVGAKAGPDAFYCTDVGEHQMWAAQYLRFLRPRHWLTSGGLGTMGYGLPASLGAQLAHPDGRVILFTGDGSIQMNIQELATAKQFGLRPKIFLLNNGYLGMVALWQRAYYNGRYSASVMDVQPDFVALAASYGHVGLRAETYDELDRAIERAFGEFDDRLVLVDVRIAPLEPVLPMVGPGQGLTDMVLAEEN